MNRLSKYIKYYCKNCKTEIKTDRDISGLQACYVCGWRFVNGYEEIIPDYETPQQYKKRTGKAYPDNGAVWIYAEITLENGVVVKNWDVCIYGHVKGENTYIVIADPHVPPPDDWGNRHRGLIK